MTHSRLAEVNTNTENEFHRHLLKVRCPPWKKWSERGVYQGKLEITELAEFGQISLGKGKLEVTKVNKFYSE